MRFCRLYTLFVYNCELRYTLKVDGGEISLLEKLPNQELRHEKPIANS